MRTTRVLVDLSPVVGASTPGKVSVAGPQFHHLQKVLRVNGGSAVEVVDTVLQLRGTGVVEKVWENHIELTISSVESFRNEAAHQFSCHLICGAPKLGAAEIIVEKGTELGVTHFSFFRAERTQGKGFDALKKGRFDRFKRIAESAIRQSGARKLPHFAAYPSLRDALTEIHAGEPTGRRRYVLVTGWETSASQTLSPGLHLILDQEGRETGMLSAPQQPLEPGPNSADSYIIVGPEGGLSREECEIAGVFSYSRASLGPRSLRVETAAIAACAVVGLLRSQ